MVWRIQASFQGGGARFIQHLAVAAALQEAENEGLIEITRVAGTSAGSLAAAIVAAGISAEATAKVLEKNKAEFVRRLGMPSSLSAAWRFACGKPIADPSVLVDLFSLVWKELSPGNPNPDMSKFKKPLLVVAADMKKRESVIFGGSPYNLIEALVHSCSIPLVYRSLSHLKHDQHLVDGGLVENLPLNALIPGKQEFGDIIAISFQETVEKQPIANIKDYISAVISLSSDFQVRNLADKIDKRLIFYIQSDFNSLDFDVAFTSHGVETSNFYQLLSKAREWILNREKAYRPPPIGTHLISVDETPHSDRLLDVIKLVYHSHHAGTRYRIRRRRLIVKAYSLYKLLSDNDSHLSNADEVFQSFDISPIDDPLFCIPLRMDYIGHDVPRAARSIYLSSQNPEFTIKPILCPVGGIFGPCSSHKRSEALLFFDPALDPLRSDLYPIKIRDVAIIHGVMKDLAERRKDFMGIKNRDINPPIEIAELILIVPEDCPEIRVTWKSDKNAALFVPGTPIPHVELGDLVDTAAGFRVLGWKAANVPPGKHFAVELEVS